MSIDWGALGQAFREAEAAFAANEPLPPAAPFSMPDAAAALTSAEPEIEKLNALVLANPGAIRAADILLAAFVAQDFTWAAPIKALVDALPGGLAASSDKLPSVIWMLTTFALASAPLPGEGPRVGRG